MIDSRDEALTSQEAQFHTHVVAAPLGRWAVFYDWLADHDLFTASEHARIRETLLDLADTLAMPQIQSRALSFDNQALANAFGAAVVGYVFGVTRGDSALGRHMFRAGVAWLRLGNRKAAAAAFAQASSLAPDEPSYRVKAAALDAARQMPGSVA